MKKLKIAIFTDVYLEVAGGIYSSIQAQKRALEQSGHEVVIFCPGKDTSKLEKNILVVPTCKHIRINRAPLARRPAIIEKWVLNKYPNFKDDFDVVHVHYEAGASIAGVRLAKKYHLPLIQTMHGREDMAIAMNIPWGFKTFVASALNWFHSWYLPHEIKVKKDEYLAPTISRAKMWTMMVNHANCADIVITPSSHFKKKLEYYGVSKPIDVLPNGVADELLEKKCSVRKVKDGEPIKMIWHSRVSNEKRILPFLRALKFFEGKYSLDVYGDGNIAQIAERYAQLNKMNVKFHGRKSRMEILKKIDESHLDIMASYGFDTQGVTLLEAEARGLPVFFCDPDMREVVPEGSYILSSGPESSRMADALNKLVFHPELIEQMSEKMIKKRFEVAQSEKNKKMLKIYYDNIAADVASKD